MRLATVLSIVLATVLFGRDARAGGLDPLVRVGDSVGGLGTVTALASRVAVDDAGDWWVLATSGSASAIIRNGQVVLRTGDPVSSPVGATVTAIRSFGVSRGGTAVWTVALSTGATGIYRGSDLAMLTGTAVLPGGGFVAGSTYASFRHAQPNGTNRFMLLGTVNTVSAGPSDFVSVVNLNGSGQATSENVRVRTDTPIAITQIIDSVPVRPEQAALNGPGETTFTFSAAGQSWVAATNVGCFTGSVCTLLLDSAGVGPTGEPLGDLLGAGVGSNSFGRWVAKVRAGTQNSVRICGNFGSSGQTMQLYAQGSILSGFSNFSVESIVFDGPIYVSQTNQIVWYANSTDPDTTRDEGILVNNQVVVREGVTATSVGTLQALDPYGFAISENGRYLVFRGRLVGGVEGAFRLDLAPATAYCFGDGTGTACPCAGTGGAGAGCPNSSNPNGARIAMKIGGSACVSLDSVTLEVTSAPATVSALFFQGTSQFNGGAGTAFGDGLRCLGGSIVRLGTKITSGGVATYPGAGDASVSVRGLVPASGGTRVYQVWYRNAADFCTPSTFNLTNGLEIPWLP
ncbi:MAG: hypothetical protein NTY35_06260 [Planctomycetota bacterium]|nr:hypothetical protein [Planctomycetota bacterium]